MKSTRWQKRVNTYAKIVAAMAIRMKPHERRTEILDAALRTASAVGFMRMTRDDIARTAGCTAGLVTVRLGVMEKLRDEVMREAVKREVLPVVAEGIALRHRHAVRAPLELRQRAAASLALA